MVPLFWGANTVFCFILCMCNKECFVPAWGYGVIRGWPGHNALQNGVIMTWPWYHNAGQTMTYLKNSQKTEQAAAAQPVWPSLSTHIVLFILLSCFPSSVFLIPTLTLFKLVFSCGSYKKMTSQYCLSHTLWFFFAWWHGIRDGNANIPGLSVEWFVFW